MVSYVIVGKHIKEARLRLNLKQVEVAEKIGISATYYGRIERGNLKPNIDRLGDICQALNTPLSSLFEGAEIASSTNELENKPVTAEEFEAYMHEVAKSADARTKQLIMRISEEILSDAMGRDSSGH